MNKKKILVTISIGLFISLSVMAAVILPTNAENGLKSQVLYIGDNDEYLIDVLNLDKESLEVSTQTPDTTDLSGINDFDTIFLNDANISNSDIQTIYNWAQIDGHGVVIVMGNSLTQNTLLLQTFGFTDQTSFDNNTAEMTEDDDFNDYKGLSYIPDNMEDSENPLMDIVWNTAPETFYFSLIPITNNSVNQYINMQWNNENFDETDYPLVAGLQVGENSGDNVYLYAGWFQSEWFNTDANEHMMVWPYFNYMIFATVQISHGVIVPIYGDWTYSAVPHLKEQIILGIVVLICGIAAVVLYKRVRNRKTEHREVFVSSEPVEKVSDEVVETAEIKIEVDNGTKVDKKDDWERIGFHRQISGFFKLYFVMILLLIPQLLVTSIIMPRFLNPYPQASGWYSYTLRFFEAIWLVFDMGFNFAITKYFAQHRIERPEKAYHYVQLFIWWEVLSGVLQIFLIAFVGSIVFPYTSFNYLSWMFVIHSLIQFPGIFLVFQYFFQGAQRSDFHMIAFALQFFVLRMVFQVVTVPIFKAIFEGNIMYGAAFGCGIGLLVGQLLGDIVLFLITMRMYQSLKLPLKPVFMADFTKEEFVETFKFGGKMILGQMWVPLGWLLQVYLVGVYLPNSSSEQGFFELAFTISTIPQAIALLMGAMMGGLTEAHTYKKKNLLNYTSFSGIKWGQIWTLYLCSTFWAIGEVFITGASGPNWVRAAALIPPLMFYRMLGPLSWQADYEFAAADKPIYAGIAWIIEQSIRAVATWYLLSTLGIMEAVIYAYWIALGTKNIVVVILIRWKIHKWDWNLWQSFIAPGLAAIVNFFLLRGFQWILLEGFGMAVGIIPAMILFVWGLFGMEFIYTFFVGLFGGYCDNTLEELRVSTEMVTGVKALAAFYYKCTKWGTQISPLHNKFRVKVFDDAMREAEELTSIKKKIVIE